MSPRRIVATGLFAFALAAGIGPGRAAAAGEPACSGGTSDAEFNVSKRVAFGREGYAALSYVNDARASFLPAAHGGVLKGAFTDAPPLADYFGPIGAADAAWRLPFAPGDGPAIVRATHIARYHGQPDCRHTLETTVTPFIGYRPTVAVTGDNNPGEWLSIAVEIVAGHPCREMRLGAIRMRVRGGGQTRSYRLDEACGEWTGVRAPRHFRLRRRAESSTRHPEVELTPKRRRANVSTRYVVTVHQGAKRLRKARFGVRWTYRPGRRIWEGSDAFVNYCINSTARIWSKGGRLYCDKPTRRGRSVKKL